MKKMLIVYYSWSNGNTKKIAEEIQQTTGADIVRIDTKTPYTGGYDAVVAQGQEEVQRGYEPPIKDLGIRLEAYKERQMQRRIGNIMQTTGAKTLEEYAKILARDSKAREAFIEHLTITSRSSTETRTSSTSSKTC